MLFRMVYIVTNSSLPIAVCTCWCLPTGHAQLCVHVLVLVCVCAQYARLFVPVALARKDFTKANLSALLKKYAHACASSAALPPFVSKPDWLRCCPLFVSGCNCACLVFACVCSSWLADGNSKFHTALFFGYVNHPVALKLQEKSTIEHSCYGDDVEPVPVTHKWPWHCLSVFLMCYSGQPNRTQQLRNRIERVWNRSSVDSDNDADAQRRTSCTTTIIDTSDDEALPCRYQVFLLMLVLNCSAKGAIASAKG